MNTTFAAHTSRIHIKWLFFADHIAFANIERNRVCRRLCGDLLCGELITIIAIILCDSCVMLPRLFVGMF
jgi:hypothetical protein